MNDGIMILTGILALFCFGTLSLILDCAYNKIENTVYVRTNKNSKKADIVEDDELIINDSVSESNIFNEE